MLPPAFRASLLLTACVSAGLMAGWTVHSSYLFLQTRGSASAPPPSAGGDGTSPDSPGTNSSAAAVPFSMEVFRAASGITLHRMLAQVLPGADDSLVRALAEQLVARPEFPPDAVWKAVLRRWVELDPPGALAWAMAVVEDHREKLVEFTAWRWAEADVEAALATAMAAGDDEALQAVHLFITAADPARALDLFDIRKKSGNAGPWLDSEFYSIVFRNWGGKDPHKAAAYLMAKFREDPVSTSGQHWKCLATGWAQKDPEGCRVWLAGLKEPLLKCAIDGLLQAVETNPAGVAKVLGVVPLNAKTRDTFLNVAGEWAAKDAPAAMAWVKERFPEGAPRTHALGKAAEGLMKSDLRAAVAIIDEIGWDAAASSPINAGRVVVPEAAGLEEKVIHSKAEGDMAIDDPFRPLPSSEVVIARLGKDDPALALGCVEKAPPSARMALWSRFVPEWFQREPEAVTRWLETLPPEKMAASDLSALLGKFPHFESDAARAWAERLPAGPLQQALAGLAFRRVDVEDPAKAVESIPFTDPASRQAALEEIVLGWSTAAPQAALDRLVGETTASPGICQEVVGEWALHDPAAASTWVAAQPPGPNRDGAIRGLTSKLMDENAQPDFPAALVWSLSITEPGARLETARSVMEKWQGNAPEAAEMRATLESTTALPEPDRQTFLQRVTP